MSLLKNFPLEDMKILHTYFEEYGGAEEDGCSCQCSIPFHKMPYILRYWNEYKKDLYKIFGKKFILEKEIIYQSSPEQMEELFYDLLAKDSLASDFRRIYINVIAAKVKKFDVYCHLDSFVTNYQMILKNKYDGEDFIVEYKNKSLKIQNGCGVIKMLKKISDMFEIDFKYYEAFRNLHSRVLQNKKTKGTLCLSIHPMDYVTMSDNVHRWDSCMAWVNYAGEFRLGTIEMMNSPYCVVAYLKSDEEEMSLPYWRGGEQFNIEWNSKKWRQLIMITPDLILGNKQYPFVNSFLENEALTWMRELALRNSDYGPYNELLIQLENHSLNFLDGEKQVYFDLDFDYMYNDIYDKRKAFFNPKYSDNLYSMNFSGPAVCIQCGEVVDGMCGKENFVICTSCAGLFYCDGCNSWETGEPNIIDGNYYCDYCYNTKFEYCEYCGNYVHNSNINIYHLCIKGFEGEINKHTICLCEECYNEIYPEQPCIYESIYSDTPLYKVRVIYLKDIPDEKMEQVFQGYSKKTFKFFKEMKEAETFEEMYQIEEKYCKDNFSC